MSLESSPMGAPGIPTRDLTAFPMGCPIALGRPAPSPLITALAKRKLWLASAFQMAVGALFAAQFMPVIIARYESRGPPPRCFWMYPLGDSGQQLYDSVGPPICTHS